MSTLNPPLRAGDIRIGYNNNVPYLIVYRNDTGKLSRLYLTKHLDISHSSGDPSEKDHFVCNIINGIIELGTRAKQYAGIT